MHVCPVLDRASPIRDAQYSALHSSFHRNQCHRPAFVSLVDESNATYDIYIFLLPKCIQICHCSCHLPVYRCLLCRIPSATLVPANNRHQPFFGYAAHSIQFTSIGRLISGSYTIESERLNDRCWRQANEPNK